MAEDHYQDLIDQDFLLVHLLQNYSNVTWAEDYGLTFPVLDDQDVAISDRYERGMGLPTYTIVNRDMTLQAVDPRADNITYWIPLREALETEPFEQVWDEPPPPEMLLGPGEGVAEEVSLETTKEPFGGASCTQAGPGSSTVLTSLLSLLALVGLRRRA